MTRVADHFSKEELQLYCRRSDLLAWVTVLGHWGIIALAFTLVAWQPNILTVVLALVILGGRQLGCGALMHECGHGSLFANKKLNRFVGEWLGAAPVLYRLDDYMTSHLKHHREIGNQEDPDLHRYERYPVSKHALRRKLWRDITGQTTWKITKGQLFANGILYRDENGRQRFSFKNLLVRWYRPVFSNLVLFSVLAALGYPLLYLLWVAAYFSTYMVCSRIRNLAEHAAVPDLTSMDPLKNTRTTIPRWWERFTFAPNSVNYHLEHHLVPAIPKYRLADFHQALKRKGLLSEADICQGYTDVVRKLVAA
ncbi:MAG: fatty acid desaturase family protein [Pseudomonadales bacterium]|nr:fatty acid desaturase family protein [Pseudomonadales bacterium]